MCNPLLIGIAATGAGIYMQNQSQKRAQKERTARVTAENQRQKAFQEEGQGSMLASNAMMDRSGGFDEGMAKEAAGLTDYYGSRLAQALNLPASSNRAPKIVQSAFEAADANAAQRNKAQEAALADLNSFSGYMRKKINPALSDSANTNAMVGNFMQGSSGALASELEAANQLAYNPLAQALMAGGQIGVNYGLKKA
jgi:type II secretory pathway pseudopilin PulG